ncbi:unnamed protein product, partial [Meganyctiphanes norvegica]
SKNPQITSFEAHNTFQKNKSQCSQLPASSKIHSRSISLDNNDTQVKEKICRAVWARSSAVLLSYHRWLNHVSDGQSPELTGSVVTSSAGVRVVELRDMQTMAFHHWEFLQCPPPSVLHLPWTKVQHWPPDSYIEVVAEDDHGNLMKGKFISRPL